MKKNLFFAAILCIGLLAVINSCVKDTFTEQDAYSEQRKTALQQDSIAKSQMEFEAQLAQEQALLLDSLKNVGGTINYSVAVVSASESSWWSSYYAWWWDKSGKGEKSETGVSAATVTIAQHGKIFTATTGTDGIASFSDLRVGTANVNITVSGYTTVDYVVELPPFIEGFCSFVVDYYDGSYTTDSTTIKIVDLVRHVATMVPVFSLTTNLSTVTGIATVETDLTNNTPEVAAGVKIMGIIDVMDDEFWSRYIYHPDVIEWWNCSTCELRKQFDYYGTIKQIAFGSTISTATTGADGSFTLQVPSTPQGLPIQLQVDEFAADQDLLLPSIGGVPVWGVQTVRTMFGPFISGSYIPPLGTNNMEVQSAYVDFSDPTGTPAPPPTTKALATAVLTSSGIVSINITEQGEGYTQPPLVRISKGSVINSVQAEGTAVLTDGMVTSVTIDSPGTGYKPGDNPTVTFAENIQVAATATPKFGYSLASVAVTGAGLGYTAAPTVIITSNTGTGAAATAVMSGYVSKIMVTETGAGYTATPRVNVAPSSGVNATATATMTINNPVHSVYVPANLNFWTRRKLGTRLVTVVDGSGATTDSTTLSSAGRVQSITLTNPGAGYNDNQPPTVTISGGGGTGAVAHATSAGGVLTLILDNQGQGYTSIPTVTIGPAPTGGTNATATALIEFQVTAVPLLSNGNGYDVAPTVQFETTPGSGTFVAAPAGVISKLSMGVASVTVGTAGTDYTAAPAITFTPSDGNVGTAATATSEIMYGVKAISVTNGGSGYEYGDIAVSLSAAPAGATAATLGAVGMNNGKLKEIIMGLAGMGYTAAPNVIVAVNPSGVIPTKQAEITATVAGGQVTALTIADAGEGYVYASEGSGYYTISISTFKATAAATAKPNPESGMIAFIQVDNPGAGYAIVPNVEIRNDTTQYPGNANGFGSGATATAVVTDGRVSAIDVTDAGTGYYVVPKVNVVVVSSVMKAIGKVTVTPDGRITGVTFDGYGVPFTRGYGYETAPTVTFTPSVPGMGTDAVGVAVIKNGQLDYVLMTNQGNGYTGKNFPMLQNFGITPVGNVWAVAGKSYIRDLYFGTGLRTVKQ
jgi:hypothetical protein